MKITDVTLTLFAWDDIPPTPYGQHSGSPAASALGLLRIAHRSGHRGPCVSRLGIESGDDATGRA